MKKIVIAITLSVLLFTSLFSQENHYWSNGNIIKVRRDESSIIVYEKDDVKLTLKSENIKEIKEKSSKRLGKYRILTLKNPNLELPAISEEKIKAEQNAYISEQRDTLYPTQLIILKFKDGNTLDNIEGILVKYSLEYLEKNYNVVTLKVSNIDDVFNAANEIYETGLVEWCRPNFIRRLKLYSEPRNKQYYIHNTYHYCGAFNNDINALEAWEITTGCDNIRVAVLDDGVENHPDLRDANGNSRVLNGYSVPNEPANGRPNISGQHGQACAGIIAASHSNNIRGIAPNVLIIPVNLGFGFQDESEWFDAMNWAWEPNGGNADILSNSWGPRYGATGNELYIEAINNAKTFGRGGDFEGNIPGLGAIVVFSSGNNGLDEVSDYAKASIAVGAIDKNDTPAKGLDGDQNTRYTNIGPNQDLVAYGGSIDGNNGDTDIRTIDREGDYGYETGNYNNHFGGTSAACPMVSGAAALILSINPNLTRAQVENILFSTATDLGDMGKDNIYGYGKLNVYEACKEAVETRTNSFILNKGHLPYTKIQDNFKMSFVGSPGCGISSGIYWCDVYKLEATLPQSTTYIGDGLSGANPNNGEYYISSTNNGSNFDILTFFYYVRTNSLGQTVNKWVPQNPADLWSREYLSTPPEDITFNGTVNFGKSKELFATNSITLTPGFHAKEGSYFYTITSSVSEDITCLPNPISNTVLKSGKIETFNETVIYEQYTTSTLLVDKTENNDRIIIYPNPNKGNLIIKIQGGLSSQAKVEIYSLSGSLKFSSAIISKQQNIIFTQAPGTYLIRVYNNEKYYTEKIILQ